MRIRYKEIIAGFLFGSLLLSLCLPVSAKSPYTAYDIDMAKEICADLPLENVEGVWLYPEDNITVMILNENDKERKNLLPVYSISVVQTSDSRLHPGDEIGKLFATADENVFKIELSTEKNNELLLKPKSCLATLSKDGDTFFIKREKSPVKARLNLNFNRLLPGFWKIVSTGISSSDKGNSVQYPVGMVKIYPSYDGNGSSRRHVRYL